MAWILVPSYSRRQPMYYERPRSVFDDLFRPFDDDWCMMPFEEPTRRFDQDMDRFRRQLSSALNTQPFNAHHESPFVTDADGNRKLSLKVDCSQFKPEDISLKTKDGVLTIEAKRVEEGSDGKVFRQFYKSCTLPENVDPTTLKSNLNKDGILQIEAPLPPAGEDPKEITIPIENVDTPAVEQNGAAAK